MALDFPNSPTLNQTFTSGTRTWIYDGSKWVLDATETVIALDNLSDVTITAPEEFQSLVYDGTTWVNKHASTVTYVRNAEATTLTIGTVVYLFGATGDHATVKRADNDSDSTSSKTVGLVAANILASQNGPVVTRGYVDGIDLSVGYSAGDILWLGEDGGFTKVKPTAPEHLVFIGVVVRATNNGIVYVATQNGYELDELHDVALNGKTSGDFLKYNGSLWVNDQINLGTDTVGNYVSDVTGGTGVTVTHTPSEGSSPTIAIGQAVGTTDNVTFAGVTADGIRIGITAANEIDTASGNLTIDSAGGTVTVDDNLIVSGNLTVSGTTTSINTETLTVDDNIIILNNNVTGSPTENAGIEIERGTSTNVSIRWNETTDKWEFTNNGSTYSELGSGGATVSDTAPSSPTVGQIWFESDTTKSFIYYDSAWVEIGGGGGSGASITVSDTAPTSPSEGALWFESDTAKTFIYYDSQWVELNGGTLSSTFTSDTAPTSPTVGSLWYETDSGALYVYYDSQWVEVGPGAVYDQILGSIQAKGDLIVGTASQAVSRQAVGSNGQKLVADSSTSTGVAWVSDTTNTAVDAKGDLLIGASDNVLARLPVSTTNGSVLVADSTATNGLSWQTQGVNVLNLLYNGAMQIHQRGTSTASITTSSYYTADRWQTVVSSLGTWTQTVETHTSPTDDIVLRQGFRKSLKMLCTTADASPAAGDYCILQQILEGQDLQAIRKGTSSAQQLTVSFWVKSGVTGTYICELNDNDNSRTVSAQYSVAVANTWEYKTITFPADLTGLLDNDNQRSLEVNFWLASGSTYSSGTLQSTWGAITSGNRAVGQTNLASGNNSSVNYWQMTGVQLTVGAIAQPFEFKSYERELRECQRYYWTDFPNLSFTALGSGGAGFFRYHGVYDGYWAVLIAFPNTMRTTPSMDFTSWTTTNTGIGVGGQFTAHAPGLGDTNAKIYTMTSVGATVGYNSRSGGVHGTVFFGARASAEL